MEVNERFDPSKYLIKLKSKQGEQDYLPVKYRLVWFRTVHPHGTIDTEEMQVDIDKVVETEKFVWNAEKRRSDKVMVQAKGYARFKAIVTDGKGGRATGTKSENAATFPDYVEKSETGAIGRALASLGFGTQFTDEEFDEGERLADAPVERRNNTTSNNYNNGSRPSSENEADTNATEQQISSIRKLCIHLHKAEPENLDKMSFLAAKKHLQLLTSEYKENRQGSQKS